jgi:hypothetical protein
MVEIEENKIQSRAEVLCNLTAEATDKLQSTYRLVSITIIPHSRRYICTCGHNMILQLYGIHEREFIAANKRSRCKNGTARTYCVWATSLTITKSDLPLNASSLAAAISLIKTG